MEIRTEKKTKPCVIELSERYKSYLDLCVPNQPGLDFSVQDVIFKPLRDETFEVLLHGDGMGYSHLYVRLPEGEDWIRKTCVVVVQGNLRNAPKRGLIHMGKTSLMGRIAHGIKSGRTFRGR